MLPRVVRRTSSTFTYELSMHYEVASLTLAIYRVRYALNPRNIDGLSIYHAMRTKLTNSSLRKTSDDREPL